MISIGVFCFPFGQPPKRFLFPFRHVDVGGYRINFFFCAIACDECENRKWARHRVCASVDRKQWVVVRAGLTMGPKWKILFASLLYPPKGLWHALHTTPANHTKGGNTNTPIHQYTNTLLVQSNFGAEKEILSSLNGWTSRMMPRRRRRVAFGICLEKMTKVTVAIVMTTMIIVTILPE